MTMSPGGYPPPDDEDDDEVARQFLDDLRVRLDNAGEYGSIPWRTERDAQIHRLASLGWTEHDLAAHYQLGRPAVRAALARHTTNSTHDREPTDHRHSYRVSLPAYAIDLTVDYDTAQQLHALAADHGLTEHITRSDPSAALTTP
ncbi:hypothetical protein [Gordonia sp. NB41Y]|uniref:hypothetical protein n=1 Tax=Gordonia sp. NB41Y TaxID=875808 RepID=UPI0002BF4893|nr:hypothetical protein [Gordonia sp. NB41Y]EMP14884.1 hypothetical protein ISGA_2028 [Gordonia sp. NB41Y]WLP89943.1 hypothetical protein Q9K23_20780 [Gordonia sp. NB41Y]